ncbi:MAG: 5'/3'-nucleotidase SurE [bacterium]|jgi:5'-nucleotidase
MFVLLTNDDGISAEGIQALVAEFSRHHEIAVAAPDRERSASGHAITMDRPLRARPVEQIGLAWAISGTPGDCVKLALSTLLPKRPDLIVSGVNRGPNMGIDVFYSGTVAAALEGLLNGVPAVAVSLASYAADLDYAVAARVARSVAERLYQKSALSRTLLNVNVPYLPQEKIKGVRITRLASQHYQTAFEARQDPRGHTYYWLVGEPLPEVGAGEDTDIAAVANGFVSITPLGLDLTDFDRLNELRSWSRNTGVL